MTMSSVLEALLNSSKVEESKEWDALYDSLPVVVAESSKELSDALSRLDHVAVSYTHLTLPTKA